MEVYARALVPRLPDAWPEAQFVAYASRELAAEWRAHPWHPAIGLREVPTSGASRFRRTLAEQALATARVDVMHSLANIAPLATRGASVVTVHDLIYKRFPDTHAGLLTKGVALLVPASVRQAKRVISVSQATADDLTRFLGTDPAKVDVVPSGPGLDTATPTPEQVLRQRLVLRGPVVVSPAARRPHKNLPRLIEAMQGLDATLVLPGYDTEHRLEGDNVVVTGWMDQPDLEGMYALARCLVFPSLAEGFGLPVLEAMRRGLPVACSDTTSLPEIAGDAALLFDPTDVGAIRAATERLLTDDALHADLAERGRERAAQFSWERAAAGTVAAYQKAL